MSLDGYGFHLILQCVLCDFMRFLHDCLYGVHMILYGLPSFYMIFYNFIWMTYDFK